jgi:hypothetical protein
MAAPKSGLLVVPFVFQIDLAKGAIFYKYLK